MGTFFSIGFAIVIMVGAIAHLIDAYHRGWRPQWWKSLTTFVGAIITTGAALGCLYAGLATNDLWLGLGGFLIIFGGGLAAVVTFVNRRWPIQKY